MSFELVRINQEGEHGLFMTSIYVIFIWRVVFNVSGQTTSACSTVQMQVCMGLYNKGKFTVTRVYCLLSWPDVIQVMK